MTIAGHPWWWLALRADAPGDAAMVAELTPGADEPAGALAAWPPDVDPPAGAAKVDARVLDPEGEPCWASYVRAPEGSSVPFDDPAVTGAIRRVLAGQPADAVSTLLLGDAEFVGSITVLRTGPQALVHDPFGLIFPARLLRVGAGLLGRAPAPTGPVGQRYGSDRPWPWDRFA